MFTARVIGSVWATRKHKSLDGLKMMLIEPIDGRTGKASGEVQMAVDFNVGSGPGDTVLIIDEGSSCRQILGHDKGPTRTIIAGVVDKVHSEDGEKKYH
ncbi:MAG: EutN/CcmL family microcompartment protein [Elusimicrobia bacterium]|nr:EutN/CcmL family microcompartment protein [Elusimicrobiota bacterium]